MFCRVRDVPAGYSFVFSKFLVYQNNFYKVVCTKICPKVYIEYPEKAQDIKMNTHIIKEVNKKSAKMVFERSG